MRPGRARGSGGRNPPHEPLVEPGEEATMTSRDERGTHRRHLLRAGLGLALGTPLTGLAGLGGALARGEDLDTPETFRPGEIVESGHRFFGSVSRGLALT